MYSLLYFVALRSPFHKIFQSVFRQLLLHKKFPQIVRPRVERARRIPHKRMESTPTAPRSRRDDDDRRSSSPFHDPVRARAADAMASTSTPKVRRHPKGGKTRTTFCAHLSSLFLVRIIRID